MASLKNDRLRFRTQLGPVNLYDNQQAIGTCSEKAHAARMGGHCFNPINHQPEKILSHLRNKSHYIDTNGVHTSTFFVPHIWISCRRIRTTQEASIG